MNENTNGAMAFEEAKQRIPSQKRRIVDLLRASGESGATNTELASIALNYQGRLQELYVEGYVIDMTSEGDGVYRYILVNEPETKREKPEKADVLFIRQVSEKAGRDIANLISDILNENKLTVRRVNGFFTQRK